MTEFFLKLVNMSISASWLILAVLVLRLVLRKAPKAMRCVLWCLVGLRLIVPFSIESVFSLIPSAEVIPQEALYATTPAIDSGINVVNQTINPILTENFAPNPGDSVNPLQVVSAVASIIWIAGMVILLFYTVFAYIRLKMQVREAVRFQENTYQSEKVVSPFILGMIKPRIYIPYTLKEEELQCVIAHERAHIRRGDHFIKPIAFLILSVYWFNPLIWLAYILLCRDIELACDEKVMQDIGMDKKKIYSETLLHCSVSHRMIAACPIAFGEVGVKHRIKNVLSYKKPTFWIVVISILACVVCVVCFMTEPKESEDGENSQKVADSFVQDSESVESDSQQEIPELNESAESRDFMEGQPTPEQDVSEILQSPPTMVLQDSLSSRLDYFEVTAGTYSWQYKDGDLMTGASAGGAAPADAVKGQEWLQLVSYNKLDYVPYTLGFSVQPNCVTVREYDLLDLGDMNAEVIAETIYEEHFVSIPLKARRIYEVIAEWDETNLENYGCYGTAYYAFATDNYIQYEEEAESVTLQAHVKEILTDMENLILISSDTDSFPGAYVVMVPPEVYDVEALSGGDSLVVTMKDYYGKQMNNIPVYEAVSLEKKQEMPELSLGDKFTEEVNNFEGVTMTMEKYKATEGDVEIYNGRDKEIQYGDFYDIQALKDGEWYSLQLPDDIAYHMVAYNVNAGETSIWQINWEYAYGELPTGKYRMVKDVMDYRAPGDFDKYFLAAEFEIKGSK